jgi:hypothetical protein
MAERETEDTVKKEVTIVLLFLHVPDHLVRCRARIHIVLKFQSSLHEMAKIRDIIDEVIPLSVGLS